MKRTLTYAFTAVLGAMMVAPAFAQDQFPDVPQDHWAYKELLEMKQNGLLVGYPDGLFRGGRPASRYELAVAVHATWAALKNQQDALKSQISDLMSKLDGLATKADLDALRAQLEALSNEVNRIKSEDIARLNRLVEEFRGELTRMGADVNQMKSDIRNLSGRIDEVEKRLPPFDFSGDLNAVALGGYSSSGRNGITVDGRPLGVGRGSTTGVVQGVTRDLTILHEGAVAITSHNQNDPKAVKYHATLVFGNMMDFMPPFAAPFGPWGDQSRVYPGSSFLEGPSSLYFQDFNINFDTSIAGLGFNAQVGRVGYKVSPYIFQRPDSTPYFANERWDNGEWNFDGAVLGFNFGRAKFDVFGGRTSDAKDTTGVLIQPMFAGQSGNGFQSGADRPRGFATGNLFMVDQMLGGHLSLPIMSNGALNLSYMWLDSNTTVGLAAGLANGVTVWGGDVNFNVSGIGIKASYSKSDIRYNGRNVVTKDNQAWDVHAMFNRDRFGVEGGYRRIEPQFGAPGDWGRIGIWWNPTDIKGFMAKAWYDLNDSLRLSASGEWYTGTGTTLVGGGDGLMTNDKLNRYLIGLEYKMASNYSLALGYEEVDWNLANRAGVGFVGGKPRERWYNIGFGFNLSDKAKLSLLWQISDYDSKGVAGFNPFNGAANAANFGPRATGGLITTQLSVKF